MKKIIFFLLMIFLYSCGKSNYVQEKKITIYGEVTADYKTLNNVKIINKSLKTEIKSDEFGNYAIQAHYNDTLIFLHENYKSKQSFVRNIIKKNGIENDSVKYSVYLPFKCIDDSTKTFYSIGKPIIYLYPEKETAINIKLLPKGELKTTFPKYENGWNVVAYPDGKIFDTKTQRFYSSLFWDGNQTFNPNEIIFKNGFVVRKEDLTRFLISKLEYIGLNNDETNEFIQYWLPILEKNNLNCIRFLINEEYNSISKNEVTPKPDSEIRVFMQFYNLENPIEIPEQNLPVLYRKGFTLVEWGGSDVSENRIKLP